MLSIKVSTEELGKAMARAVGIVDRKSSMPILSNVLLTVSKDGLLVSAFDGDIGITSEVACEVLKPGSITLPAHPLHDLARSLPEASVTLEEKAGSHVEIISGKAKFKMAGIDATDYPPLPSEASIKVSKVDGPALLAMLGQTSFSISEDATRGPICGLLIDGEASRIVATNGHTLSAVTRKIGGAPTRAILPLKAVGQLQRALEEAPDAETSLGFSGTSGLLRRPGMTMVLRLLEGSYPDVTQVIPDVGSGAKASAQRAELLASISRVAMFSKKTEFALPVDLKFSEGYITVSASNEMGDAAEDVAAEYAGKTLIIRASAGYLQDAIKAVDGERIDFEVPQTTEDGHPLVIRHSGAGEMIQIVMPMARQ